MNCIFSLFGDERLRPWRYLFNDNYFRQLVRSIRNSFQNWKMNIHKLISFIESFEHSCFHSNQVKKHYGHHKRISHSFMGSVKMYIKTHPQGEYEIIRYVFIDE